MVVVVLRTRCCVKPLLPLLALARHRSVLALLLLGLSCLTPAQQREAGDVCACLDRAIVALLEETEEDKRDGSAVVFSREK